MNETEFNRLLEAAQRRPLTAEEETRLREYGLLHPQAQALCEKEAALTQLLRRLPPAPLSSNFTARVLQAVSRETPEPAPVLRVAWRRWFTLGRPLKLGALGAAAAAVILLAYHQRHLAGRAELAQSLAALGHAAALAEVEVWQNFDAIRRLSELPEEVDPELISTAAP